ncbi:MAG: tripartite tricarboxylate transporter permease [Bauldia sp.]
MAVLQPARLAALVLGILLGFLAGILPGIGGRIGLLLALPLVVAFDPLAGAVFLLALHSVVHTSGSITPIAYGLPTSASEAATVIDGFQLQQKGRGSEALGASLSASSIGGIVGAIFFIAVIPVARPIITNLGAPEFLVLSLLGLSLVATLSDRQVAGGIAVAALGLLASTVGLDRLTAVPRFTFDRLELWDGLQLVSIIGGLFVVPEMLSLARSPAPVTASRAMRAEFRQLLRGMAVALRYRMVLLRSTVIGIVIGMMPGVGASVAVWIAYADAARTTKEGPPVGTGSLAGVIAPEAANNSKEGGALIPTIYFGIPGSSSMAILMGGLAMLGLEPGPRFLGPDLPMAISFAWAVLFGNLLTIPLFLIVVPFLVRMTAPRPAMIVPFALVAIVTAALGATESLFTLGQFIVGGMLGLLLRAAGLPRAPFLLGFVMGPIAETSLGKTIQVFGASALLRPGVIILGAVLLVVLFRLRRPAAVRTPDESFAPAAAVAAFVGMIVLSLGAIIAASDYRGSAWIAPTGVSLVLIGAAIVALVRLPSRARTGSPELDLGIGAAFVSLLVALPLVGLLPATAGFLLLVRRHVGRGSIGTLIAAILVVAAAQYLFISGLFGKAPVFGLLSRLL